MTQDQLIGLIAMLDLSEEDKTSMTTMVREAASPSDVPEEVWTLLRISSRGTEAQLRSEKRRLAKENVTLGKEKHRVMREGKHALSRIETQGIAAVKELETETLRTLDAIDDQSAKNDENTKRKTEGTRRDAILKQLRNKPPRHP